MAERLKQLLLQTVICKALLFFVIALLPFFSFAQSYGDGNYGNNAYGGTDNQVPLITLSAPTTGQSFTVGAQVAITASASDTDGSIAQVQFFVDDVSIGTSSSPYTKSWTASGVGSHSIAAVATDNEGAHATATVSISVTSASSGGGGGSSSSKSPKKSPTKEETTSTPTTQTDILDELRKKVIELTALLAQLLAQRNETLSSSPTGFVFVNDLTVGSEHQDVLKLQKFLNSQGFIISSEGVGSPGNETNYFGQLTRQALAMFQSTHDIVPAVGYFGPVTRTIVNLILKR